MKRSVMLRSWGMAVALVLAGAGRLWAADATLTIQAADKGVPLSPDMYGIFFEDINHAADGGLYAEMVRNRGMEDYRGPEGAEIINGEIVTPSKWKHAHKLESDLPGWTLVGKGGTMARDTAGGLNEAQATSLKLTVTEAGRVGIANGGYWGMNVRQGAKYDLSFFARTGADFKGKLTATLESADGKTTYATAEIPGVAGGWKQYKASFTATGSDPAARLVIAAEQPGTIWFDMVSLFPQETFKGRTNGLRKDLAQMLADLKPSFIRFPGGCVVEGCTLGNRIQWKKTIGKLEERPGRWNIWNYYASEGIGHYEYLQMAEDLGATGMYVVPVGMSCQFRGKEVAPLGELEPYIQEALEGIEYAIGPAESKWGALRVRDGHAAPFPLKYVEIGNENWGPQYSERYQAFYKAIKGKYPSLLTILNTQPSMRRPYAEQPVPGNPPTEIIDEHFYETVEWFANNAHRYDNYDRKGPKVYVGEYACNKKVGSGHMLAALSEAAFITGMERNADVVIMSSYAPTFINIHDPRWGVDMIGYDSSRCFGRSSYWVQRLFSTNRPAVVVPAKLVPAEQVAGNRPPTLFATAGRGADGMLIVKVVNMGAAAQTVALELAGGAGWQGSGEAVVLSAEKPTEENSVEAPEKIVPKTGAVAGVAEKFEYTFKPYSMTVLKLTANGLFIPADPLPRAPGVGGKTR